MSLIGAATRALTFDIGDDDTTTTITKDRHADTDTDTDTDIDRELESELGLGTRSCSLNDIQAGLFITLNTFFI